MGRWSRWPVSAAAAQTQQLPECQRRAFGADATTVDQRNDTAEGASAAQCAGVVQTHRDRERRS